MQDNISLTQQRYLETIYELTQKHGHAHVKDIAEKIGIRMASVTEAVRNLSDLGFVNHKARRAVTLTAKGEEIGAELEARHRILADFIHSVMGSSSERAEHLACEIEHVVDLPFMNRLSLFIAFLREKHPEIITAFHEHQRKLLPSSVAPKTTGE